MRTSHLLLGVAGAGLFALGAYLAHGTGPAVVEAAPVVAPAATHARSAPALAARRVDPDLRDADPRVRATAVRESDDADALLAATRDASLDVALRATGKLGALYAEGAVPASALIALATDRTRDEKQRVLAMNGLASVPAHDAAAVLANLARSGDTTERRAAVLALSRQDRGDAVPVLIDALGDADALVGGNAREALQHLARGRDFGTDASAWRAWWRTVVP